jgi:hypothetical protein
MDRVARGEGESTEPTQVNSEEGVHHPEVEEGAEIAA